MTDNLIEWADSRNAGDEVADFHKHLVGLYGTQELETFTADQLDKEFVEFLDAAAADGACDSDSSGEVADEDLENFCKNQNLDARQRMVFIGYANANGDDQFQEQWDRAQHLAHLFEMWKSDASYVKGSPT